MRQDLEKRLFPLASLIYYTALNVLWESKLTQVSHWEPQMDLLPGSPRYPLWVIQASILLILLLLRKVILSYFKSRFDSRKLANIGQKVRPNYTVNPVTAVTGRANSSPPGWAAPAHIDKLAL